MSIKVNRIHQFWDAVRALTYDEMLQITDELSCHLLADDEGFAGKAELADMLNDAAKDKPTNEVTTRGSS